MIKKLFNTLWELLGWLIMGATSGLVGIWCLSDFLVDGYNKPIQSDGFLWFIGKYPLLILFFTLGVGCVLFAIVSIWGFFYRLVNGKNP